MFIRAEKTNSKLRLALAGPPGSGKTYTALTLAHALADAPVHVHGVADKLAVALAAVTGALAGGHRRLDPVGVCSPCADLVGRRPRFLGALRRRVGGDGSAARGAQLAPIDARAVLGCARRRWPGCELCQLPLGGRSRAGTGHRSAHGGAGRGHSQGLAVAS